MTETNTGDGQYFAEGYHVYGYVRCADCEDDPNKNGRIDLSEADDLDEAKEIWNSHIERVHG